ncbi:MAG: hypothetical protein PHN72_03945 [Bacilli bacterium]|nr:hypothetical protein [Bacilli bacterium]
MKIGIRTPSISKSIKARTTGRIKRALKRSINPLYGRKGMGLINNPKKAVYNKIYNKTSVGITEIFNIENTNKGLYIFMSIITLGLWIPIYFLSQNWKKNH